MKMNKKGFTLIELLAVIIILGVLMIIAIPSVTTNQQLTKLTKEENYNSLLKKYCIWFQ